MKKKTTHYFIIGTFVTLYLIVSAISTVHVINFFELSNPKWLAISLALAFEVGAAASLSSLIILEKMNKFLVWTLFIILTAMQAMGNTYYAYTHLSEFRYWSELFGIVDEDIIFQKRLLSIISGAILPIVSLGFIKSLVDYIKPSESDSNVMKTTDIKGEPAADSPSIDLEPEIETRIPQDEILVEDVNTELDPQENDQINVNPSNWADERIEPVNFNKRIEDPVLRYRMGIK